MIVTVDGLEDGLFNRDPDEYRRLVKLVHFLDVHDSSGTSIGRIQSLDTETMEIDVVLTNPSRNGHTVYLDGNDVVTARAKVPHATLWIRDPGDDRSKDQQVDKDLKPISKEAR
jgi:hypothetical protein